MDKTIHSFKALGWSQDSVARVIGCTRPAYKRWLNDATGLTLEQEAKLNVLFEMQVIYGVFVQDAIRRYAYEEVWVPAYRNLSEGKS